MLREMSHVSQVPNDYFRRYFADEDLNLLVWYQADMTIWGFQFTYGKADKTRVLTWLTDRGFSHAKLRDGEESPLANRSPMLTPSNDFDRALALASFDSSAATLPPREKEFVRKKLAEAGLPQAVR